jgi:hypothetical protein
MISVLVYPLLALRIARPGAATALATPGEADEY